MALIYPTQPQRELHREQVQQSQRQPQAPPIYQIVVSEELPCFDPLIAIKNLFMDREQARQFTRFGLIHRPKLVLVYLVGLVLRIVASFLPRILGEILAVLSAILQFPTIVFVIMAFRWEYVKVLVHTFEFWFLTSTTTLWVVCCVVYVHDLRAVQLPIVWVDFIDLVLIETYFGDSKTIFLVAIASGLYLVLLTGMVSFSGTPDGHHSVTNLSLSNQVDALTGKDALVNAMGTMVTLVVRLAYRKYNIMKHERRGATWTQSITYRCRIALRTAVQVEMSASRRASVQRSATNDRQQSMRFIKIPAVFHADNTVYRRIGSCNDLKRWQIIALYACGGVGYAMLTFVMTAAHSDETFPAIQLAIPVISVAGLSATFFFWLYFLSCCQRQLLARLCTSFDFLFLLVQLITSAVSACDMLLWRWTTCCAIFAELLWMVWVLILDALTPVMKARLRLKIWYGVLVIVLHLVKQVVFLNDVLSMKSWSIQNRVLLDTSIGGYEVQFRVFPFLFSRQVTTMIWCVRILHRIWTRKSENDLVMLLGNVEYDCRPTVVETIVPATETQRPKTYQ